MAGRRGFGQITRLPSKRYRARYTGPDTRLHNGLTTFDTREDAEAWLVGERRKISRDEWTPPRKASDAPRPTTFGGYTARWLDHRDLKPRTLAHYGMLLDRMILPTFGEAALTGITSEDVRDWYSSLDRARPTLRSHAYGLLRAVLATAVTDEKIPHNPAHIRGAGSVKRVKQIEPASLAELAALTEAMPPRLRPMVLLASWCALRFGELTELRRKDVDLTNGVIHVRRGVVRAGGEVVVGSPKSEAGRRDVAIPPHLIPMLREHLGQSITGGRDGLLFPAAGDPFKHLAPASLYRPYYAARAAAGRPDLRWHDLRHSGAVLAASTGATLAELMARLGHSTPQAAMRYQHAAKGRDQQIARALSALAEADAR